MCGVCGVGCVVGYVLMLKFLMLLVGWFFFEVEFVFLVVCFGGGVVGCVFVWY